MKTTNTVPYTNARREGRTHPGLIEMRTEVQVPSSGPNGRYFVRLVDGVENRADRRARRQRLPVAAGTRRNPVSRWQRRHEAVES